MRLLLALAVLCVLTACVSQTSDNRAPDNNPTLPPGGAFKDGLLYAAVKARLAGSDIDSTTRVSVIVRDGVVTLRGAVPDLATKERDAKLVRTMRGVKDVNDELSVGHAGPSAAQAVRNAAVVAAVESALAAQTGVNVTGVTVAANNGTVTLAGHVSTAAIKSTMLAAAKKAPGVRNVVDRIAVK